MTDLTTHPREFLSTRTNANGHIVWTVFAGAAPLCADTTRERAEAVARQYGLLPATLPVWDGDAGMFTTREV